MAHLKADTCKFVDVLENILFVYLHIKKKIEQKDAFSASGASHTQHSISTQKLKCFKVNFLLAFHQKILNIHYIV